MVVSNIRKAKGFTLIELMLASALLMTVMYAGYFGYSLYSQKWQKRVDIYWQSTKQGIGLDALNKLFISASKYIVKNDIGREGIYFEATAKTIKFVSSSPIFSPGPSLVLLEIRENNGLKQIIYKEMSLSNQPLYLLSDLENMQQWEEEAVLLDNLTEATWSFYGWTSFQDALAQVEINETAGRQELRKDYQLHDVNKIRVFPVRVNFSLQQASNVSNFSIEMPNHSVFSVIANFRNDA